MKLTRRQLYETEYIADLLLELVAAEAANDVKAIEWLKDEIAFDRAELRQVGSGVVTDAMKRHYREDSN